MAISPRQRQKKVERKRAKQKTKKKALARGRLQGLADQLQRVSVAPILHCCANSDIWEQGIGHILLSRELHDGKVAFGVFLTDLFCLGVKDAWGAIGSRGDYDERLYGPLTERCILERLDPPAARKLVEGSVAYAVGLGIDPHPDYEKVKPIFGNINAGECADDFEYGRDGKPFFVAGPHDTPEKCRRIMAALQKTCGPDGYHYLMPVPGSMLVHDDGLDDEDFDNEDFVDDEDDDFDEDDV